MKNQIKFSLIEILYSPYAGDGSFMSHFSLLKIGGLFPRCLIGFNYDKHNGKPFSNVEIHFLFFIVYKQYYWYNRQSDTYFRDDSKGFLS